MSEICQKVIFPALFKENPLRNSFKDPFSLESDISLDPYDSIWLKLTTILVYCVEVLASIVMVAFVAFETQGFAGHYRTLINQLLSYLYGGVSVQIGHQFNSCNSMYYWNLKPIPFELSGAPYIQLITIQCRKTVQCAL